MYNKKQVFEQYLAGKCTPEQATWLIDTFSDEEFRAELERYVEETFEKEEEITDYMDIWGAVSKDRYPVVETLIFDTEAPTKVRRLAPILRWIAAAAAVVILFIGYQRNKEILKPIETAEDMVSKQDKEPATTDGVTLTLPNGETVELSDNTETIYASKEDQNGDSFFEMKKLNEAREPMIQEVNVPAGKTGALLLTDGTKVWLNAASKLIYDVNFVGGVRKVELEGEAYFEVAPNKEKPFVVYSRNQQVRVLGTHFNVRAYGENRTTTTLMEGRVEVATHTRAYTLKPGQSSVVTWGGADIEISPAMMYKVNAWRNSEFGFYDASLEEIGRELSRWYGVDVQVVGKTSYFGFTGVISKRKTLEEVLDILNRTGQIRYHIVPVGIKERRVVLMA